MDTVMCLTSTSSVRGRSEFTMGTATPRSLKTEALTAPRSSSDCSKTCKAIVAALRVPQEGRPALIQHIPGGSRDPKSIQYLTACSLLLQEEGQFSYWNRTSTAPVLQLLGHGDSRGTIRDRCFCTWQGPAPWVLCSFALSDGRQESPAGSWVSFVIPRWPISAPHAENWSGPSGEQTLSSGHLPFEAFQKGERALKTE